MSDDEFKWPCIRKEAHAEHDFCPGVRAHPSTMIGGAHLEELPKLKFEWPRQVTQVIPCNVRAVTSVGTIVQLSAPIGVDGSNEYETYRVISIDAETGKGTFERR